MIINKMAIWLILPLLLTACSSNIVLSKRIPAEATGVYRTSGLAYSLPRLKLKVLIYRQGDNRNIVKVPDPVETRIEADPDHYYVLDYNSASSSDDKIDIALTDQEGKADKFLSKIEVTTTDRTKDVIAAFVDVAKAVVYGIPPPVPEAAIAEGEKLIQALFIDPADACTSEQKSKDKISNTFKSYGVKCRLYRGGREDLIVTSKNYQNTLGDSECTGVCFRPEQNYDLVFQGSDGKELDFIVSISMPNAAPVLSIDITRAAFVTKTATLTFDNGLLRQVVIDKPSQLAAFAQIPVDIARSILSVPAELVQLRINSDTSEKNLIEAQKNLITTNKDLIQAQIDLLNKQKELQALQDSGDKAVNSNTENIQSEGFTPKRAKKTDTDLSGAANTCTNSFGSGAVSCGNI